MVVRGLGFSSRMADAVVFFCRASACAVTVVDYSVIGKSSDHD